MANILDAVISADASEQADWEESQADNWARHPRREQRDRTD